MLRASVANTTCDVAAFERLRAAFLRGEMGQRAARLRGPLAALDPKDLRSTAHAEPAARDRAVHAMRGGKVAVLVLNGGMATRFGGEPKGVVKLVDDRKDTFLSIKLAQVRALERREGARVPVVLMHSFATAVASDAHLQAIEWAGIPARDRFVFHQSILPRIDTTGNRLDERPDAETLADTDLYAAPGHGDALVMIRASGTVERLRARGVEHVLVSNVDNLGADLDPEVLAVHLAAVAEGHELTVEVVPRLTGDAGGCVARVSGRAIIVEGFRMPEGSSPDDHHAFNTNTLWFSIDALARAFEPTFFAVQKTIELAGQATEVVQFEQLIGQASEVLATAYVQVNREDRFLPIKTRDDLVAAEPVLRGIVARTHAGSPADLGFDQGGER